jgi:hypothetical protein
MQRDRNLIPRAHASFGLANCEFIGSGFKVQRSLFILHAAIQSGSMQIRVLKAARTFPYIIESVPFIWMEKLIEQETKRCYFIRHFI